MAIRKDNGGERFFDLQTETGSCQVQLVRNEFMEKGGWFFEAVSGAEEKEFEQDFRTIKIPKWLQSKYNLAEEIELQTSGHAVVFGADLFHLTWPTILDCDGETGVHVGRSKINQELVVWCTGSRRYDIDP